MSCCNCTTPLERALIRACGGEEIKREGIKASPEMPYHFVVRMEEADLIKRGLPTTTTSEKRFINGRELVEFKVVEDM